MQSDGSDISEDEESASSVEIGVGRGYGGARMDDRRGGASMFGGDSYDFPIDFNQMPTAGTLNLDSRGAGTQRSTAKNASSKPKAKAKTQVSAAAPKMAGATVRRTALGGGLDDLSRFGIGSRASPQPKSTKRDDAMDFQKFLEESDSDEESSKRAAPRSRAAPSQNPQGDAASDSPPSSPAAKPAVLARSPAKVAELASEKPRDTVPSRPSNITSDSPSPTSPRSGSGSGRSGSRSGSPVAALPRSPRSASHSVQSSAPDSPKPQPRASLQSRSQSHSPSSSQPPVPRSRSPSPAPVSTESESSAPVESGSVFSNIRPMSDLVAATPKTASTHNSVGVLGGGQRTATTAFSAQASTTSQPKIAKQSAAIGAEVASPESTAAKRASMHYEEDFEASSTGSALVQTPRAAPVLTPAAVTVAASTTTTAAPTIERASVPATVPSAAAFVRTEPKSQTYQEPSRDTQEDRGMPLRRSTRDVQVQASIPVDVGVQCDLLDVPRAPGWATSASAAPWGFSPWEQALSAGYPHAGLPAGFGPYGMMPMPPPGYFPWTPLQGPGFPFVAPWGKAGPTGAPPEPTSDIGPGAPPAAPPAALWAMRMVDDSFKDQIELLRQAAQRHRSLLQKGRGPPGEVVGRSGDEVGAA